MSKSSSDFFLFGIDFGANPGQRELIRQINEDPQRKPVVFCRGDAGTGKTFAALAGALSLVRGHGSKRSKYKTLYYVREPVEVGHRLGYLKGTEEDKFGPYLGPLLDNYSHLMAHGRKEGVVPQPLRQPKKHKMEEEEEDSAGFARAYSKLPLDIVPLAPEFLRGRSFENCIIIVDEAQNLTLEEMQMLVTRIGNYTKMIVLGSPNQIDIPGVGEDDNAFTLAYQILEPTGLVGYVHLTEPMRSGFVAEFDQAFVAYKKAHPKPKKSDYFRRPVEE
jgi:phosphate starvation-inducible PhoH-like protein